MTRNKKARQKTPGFLSHQCGSAHVVADVLADISDHENRETQNPERKCRTKPRKFIHLIHPVVELRLEF
jgi:hypothetical protein